MNAIEKQHITSILDKEKLTMYEVGQLVEYLSKWLNVADGPGRFSEVSTAVKEDIDNAVRAVSGLSKKLMEIYETIQNGIQSAYEATEQKADETYKKYQAVVNKVNGDIKALEKIQFPEIRLPYNWEEVVKMTERLSCMTQEERQVFYEIIDRYTLIKSNQ